MLESSTKSNQEKQNLDLEKPNCSSWKQCLDFLAEGKSVIPLKENGLRLVSYQELSNDESHINKILNNPFSSKSYMPIMDNPVVYNDSSYEGINFKLLPIFKTEALRGANDMVGRIKRKRSIIEHYGSRSELQVVKLNWKYKGKDLVTYSVVNDKEIVYDDILTNLYVIEINSQRTSVYTTNAEVNRNPNEDCPTSSRNISYHDNIVLTLSSWSGENARAEASITVTGIETINCIKYIHTKSKGTYANADWGYSAAADVGITSFRPAGSSTDGWCDYELAVAVSNGYTVSLVWNGASFSISGGGTSRTKGKYVTPDMLN